MPPLPSNTSSDDPLQVICAWPVSGQYGFGTRILYYVLIATCLAARGNDVLVTPCLAVALVLPAVAALHGIVLAALHNPHAVDMDIFGAFHLCSIGIIVAPLTIMMSKTYFEDPGRNTIFLWTFLQLVGLLSLAVEFYRIETSDCIQGNSKPLPSSDLGNFPYIEGNNCGLICSIHEGPSSPLRGGSANNIYVIPAPNMLTFGAGTLLAVACCIYAVLCLVTMWGKVAETNWRRNSTDSRPEGEGKWLNQKIGYFLTILAAPVFGGVGLAILIVGEINFFSSQVRYQTEPMANVGQWAPVVGTSLAMLASLYMLLANHIHPSGSQQVTSSTERQRPGGASSTNLYRRKVQDMLYTVGEALGAPSWLYITEPANKPTTPDNLWVPGEEFRNDRLSGGDIAHSRANSFLKL
ncbi:hypothetical protein CDV31_015487 [Fusarium ambrosium]|uniref:Uncharacterized protein n=1 Tax=Fusarium ambrosium TaxID=131363 RepID=A0A428SNH6_9HYPO|nr:hypothetical protein CDV31_015487 [Fusarium ambrosium]